MPTRKKPKGKTKPKPKRKKASATKAAKKPRRASPKKAKRTAKAAKLIQPSPPERAAPPGKRIGVVTHYFGHVSVALIRLESDTLRLGDVIHIRGHTTDFEQKVESLQVDHAAANEVGPKDDFGLKVVEPVREHDVVFKVRS